MTIKLDSGVQGRSSEINHGELGFIIIIFSSSRNSSSVSIITELLYSD